MRTLLIVFTALALGCASNAPELPEPPAEGEAAGLLSTVHMADGLAEPQLLEGFHAVEQGAWRWTGKVFRVKLARPPLPEGEAAHLELKFTIPGVSVEKLGTLTLAASVNGQDVGEETYSEAGEFLFSRPVEPSVLGGADEVEVRFALDQVMVPGGGDDRELGVVALSVSLR